MAGRTTLEGVDAARVSPLLTHGPDPIDPVRLLGLAEDLTDGAAECGLVVVRDGRPARSLATSGEWAARVEAIQVAERAGPSVEAATSQATLRAPDLSRETRWAGFARRAVREYDAHGVLSIPVPLGGADRASLTFYSREPSGFDDLGDAVLAVLAPVAGLSVEARLRQEEVADLRAALESNRRIGMAMGLLIADGCLSADDAFAQLVGTSQRRNRKLRDVAEELVAAPRPPGRDGRRR
jgi:hypothetical protein